LAELLRYYDKDDSLKRHLLGKYNKALVPPPDPNTGSPLNVTIYMYPYDIMRVVG
jgi:hypothetical protein